MTRYAVRAIYTMNNITMQDDLGVISEFSLTCGRIARTSGITPDLLNAITQDKSDQFWADFRKSLDRASGKSEQSTDVSDWVNFYKKFFGLDVSVEAITKAMPAKVKGFDRLIVVAEGLTVTDVWDACKKAFKCWELNRDLEAELRKSERGPVKTTTARWFRDQVEADEETKNFSADDLEATGAKGITLIERMLFELKYFDETGKHLDVKNVTLCSGSRGSGGRVPSADWCGDEFGVDWSYADDRHSGLRSRVAVTL